MLILFLRFSSRQIRKRNFVITILIICFVSLVGFAITNGNEYQWDQTQKEHQYKDPSTIIMNIENASYIESQSIDNMLRHQSSEPLPTVMPAKTNLQFLFKELLSEKNYPMMCSKHKDTPLKVEPDYTFIKSNSDAECSRKSFIAFLVLSHVSNFRYRDKIRQSWGSIRQLQNKKLNILFFVFSNKLITENERLAVEKERSDYLDIVVLMEPMNMQNDVNIYLRLFEFAIIGCNKADYFIFVNDNMFVNIPTILEAILTHKVTIPSAQRRSLLLCKVKKNIKAERNKTSMWFISNDDWSDYHYPPHCDFRYGIVMEYDVLRDLLLCSFYAKSFLMADVFITGLLPKKLELITENFLEDFSTTTMQNHHTQGDISHNVFLIEGGGYSTDTWRFIFSRSLREI